jgi:hypothetical protein
MHLAPLSGAAANAISADVLIPMLDLNDTADPVENYLAALRLLEGVAGDVDVPVPATGPSAELIRYTHAHSPSDPRAAWRARTATPAPRLKKRARRDARIAIGPRHKMSPAIVFS